MGVSGSGMQCPIAYRIEVMERDPWKQVDGWNHHEGGIARLPTAVTLSNSDDYEKGFENDMNTSRVGDTSAEIDFEGLVR